MSNTEQNEKTRFGLTPAEYDDLKNGIRYGLIIVAAIGVTFLIVAVGSRALLGS